MSKILNETVALDDLKPYAGNARRHGRAQVEQIAASMKEVGITNPILVDENGVIIAGHGRYLALKLLGYTHVPIIRISGLTEAQKRALRLADNRLAEESTWDIDQLRVELDALIVSNFEMELTAFSTIELDRYLTPPPTVNEELPIPPLPTVPVSRKGDLWEAGGSRLLVGDARDPLSYRFLLGNNVADMVFADPPWNVRIADRAGGGAHPEFQMGSGEWSDDEFAAFLSLVLALARDASRDGSLHYICCDWRMVGMLQRLGSTLFAKMMNLAVWVKPNGGQGSFYRSQHELVAIFKHGTVPHVNNIQLGRLGRYRSNVWQYPGASGFSKTRKKDLADHPTLKPLALVADAIRDATKPGDLVLDSFGGAGSTLLAAEQTKRRAALIEIEPRYADVTLRRFQEATGKEPLLLPDRVPFSVVKKNRAVDHKEAS